MFSVAHPELGLRMGAIIFQHSQTLHYLKTVCMYLRGRGYLVNPKQSRSSFLFQTANTILFPNLIPHSPIRIEEDMNMIFRSRYLSWVKH